MNQQKLKKISLFIFPYKMLLSTAIGFIFLVLLFNVSYGFSMSKFVKLNKIFFDLHYQMGKRICTPTNEKHLSRFDYKWSQKYEALLIGPHYVTLTLFMVIYNILKPAAKGLERNISFLRIVNTDKCCYDDFLLTVGCDWCSMNNGAMETVRQNLIKNPELIEKIDVSNLKYFNLFFSLVLAFRQDQITDNEVKVWRQIHFSSNDPRLFAISKLYLQLEQVELRWCPFKRSKEFYYRNRDSRFIFPSIPNIYKVGKILSEHDTVTCEQCPVIVNNSEEFKNVQEQKESLFVPFLNFLIEDLN